MMKILIIITVSNMTEDKFILENYEQSQISNIEEQHNRLISEIANFVAYSTTRFVSSHEILRLLNRLREYERYFLSCEPVAQYLNDVGKFTFSKKLNDILNDVRESIKIFQQSYQSRFDHEKQVLSKQREVRGPVQETVNTQKSNEEFGKKFHAYLTESCRHCGENLSGNFYNREICPNCGRYLHR